MITWDSVKEVFFTIGSLAGAYAFLQPYLDKRNDRDLQRALRIKGLVDERNLAALPEYVYAMRRVYSVQFDPFDQLVYEVSTKQDGVRFTGPLSRYFNKELMAMLHAYGRLRKYIQVPWWEPSNVDENGKPERVWDFNKEPFEGSDGVARNYTAHLDEAHDTAIEIRNAFYRFQLVSELHLYEIPFARWVLGRRFKRHLVEASPNEVAAKV